MTSFALLDDGGAPAPGVPAPVRGVPGPAADQGSRPPRRRLADLPDGREGVAAFLGKRASAMADLGSARRRTCPCLSLSESTTC